MTLPTPKRYRCGWIQGNGPFDEPEPGMIVGNWSPECVQYYRCEDVDALLADAMRYRFIRDTPWYGTPLGRVISHQQNALWDSEIDAAMKAK